MYGPAQRSKKFSTSGWLVLRHCTRLVIVLYALAILHIGARASSFRGESNRLTFAVRTSNCAVTPEEFRIAYPQLLAWIQKTLGVHEKNAQPVTSMHFARLPQYFDHSLLETVKFIAIDRVPLPPLAAMGLGRFSTFEEGNFDGIAYLNRYFIKQTAVTEEGVHFHELIHVIQWRLLEPEGFLAAYANGLDKFGYENSPLEKMAYDAETLFKRSPAIFDAEKFVAEQLELIGVKPR
jgi:hypothetical protein